MKKITLLVLVLLLVLTLFSCQKQSDDTPETTAPETENAPTTETTAPETTEKTPPNTNNPTDSQEPNKDTEAPEPEIEMPEANPASDFEYRFTQNQKYILITKYIGKTKNVVIPSEIEGRKVTSLYGTDVDGFLQGVFQDSNIETVIIPNTVLAISNRSFKNCTSLTSVTIQNNSKLHTISIEAFENCSSLSKINLPNSITTIESKAFYGCSSLVEIDLPNELTELKNEAIVNCTSLKKISIPTKVNLDSGFRGNAAIYNNPALEEVVFEEGWQKINGYVFIVTSSTIKVTIPKTVTAINPMTFGNTGKMNIYFSGDCPQFVERDYFVGDVTIYYDPSTKGWDNCSWKDHHTLKPIQ